VLAIITLNISNLYLFAKKMEMSENLKSLGYEIFGKNALIGEVKSESMREWIVAKINIF